MCRRCATSRRDRQGNPIVKCPASVAQWREPSPFGASVSGVRVSVEATSAGDVLATMNERRRYDGAAPVWLGRTGALAGIAQLVGSRSHIPEVAGSSPATRTTAGTAGEYAQEGTMVAYSRSAGPALQRHHEDGAALASELVAADVPERADLAQLHRALTATPFTGITLAKARRIAAKLLQRDDIENARHDELHALHRRFAGEYERRNAETYAGQEKTDRLLETDDRQGNRTAFDDSTTPAELTLTAEADL